MARVVIQTHCSVTLYVKCLVWAPYCVNSWVCHITRVVIFLLLGLYFSYLLRSWHFGCLSDIFLPQYYCPTFVVHLQIVCLWRPLEVIPVIKAFSCISLKV